MQPTAMSETVAKNPMCFMAQPDCKTRAHDAAARGSRELAVFDGVGSRAV